MLKKTLALISSVAMLSTCGAVTAFASEADADVIADNSVVVVEESTEIAEDYTVGDVNSDGSIDARDSVIVLKNYAEHILALADTSDAEKAEIDKLYYNSISDVNEDGNCDSEDALIILLYYARTLTNSDYSESITDFYAAGGRKETLSSDIEERINGEVQEVMAERN